MVSRIPNRIWRLMGPLLIVATILALPVCNADAYGAADPGIPVAAGSVIDASGAQASSVMMPALEPVPVPYRCETSCNPTNPLNNTAHQARNELPAERFAVLLTQSVPLHFADAGAGAAMEFAMLSRASSPPSPPPQI